jgi:hypothetical protein
LRRHDNLVHTCRIASITFANASRQLTSAYIGLSSSIDKAIKAYIDHTEVVLSGESSFDISQLLQPFQGAAGAAQVAEHAIQHSQLHVTPHIDANGNPVDPKKRQKRPYKPRDPNAPKRPLTAYFRFLREVRPVIAAEISNNPPSDGTKAGDISKIATEQWKALGDARRKIYHDAYKSELTAYEDAVKAYKAAGGNLEDAPVAEEEVDLPTPELKAAAVEEEEDDDDEEEESSSGEEESSSEEESEEEEEAPARPPPPPAKSAKGVTQEAAKKTHKVKKTKAGADVSAPSSSAINPNIDPQLQAAPPAPMAPTPSKKRKAATDDASLEKKKKGRVSKKDQAAADAAAAAAQLTVLESSQPDAVSGEKKKKKKRKSEAVA